MRGSQYLKTKISLNWWKFYKVKVCSRHTWYQRVDIWFGKLTNNHEDWAHTPIKGGRGPHQHCKRIPVERWQKPRCLSPGFLQDAANTRVPLKASQTCVCKHKSRHCSWTFNSQECPNIKKVPTRADFQHRDLTRRREDDGEVKVFSTIGQNMKRNK